MQLGTRKNESGPSLALLRRREEDQLIADVDVGTERDVEGAESVVGKSGAVVLRQHWRVGAVNADSTVCVVRFRRKKLTPGSARTLVSLTSTPIENVSVGSPPASR